MHSFVTLPVHGIVNSIDDHQQVCNLAKMSLSRWTDERITNMSTSDFRIQKQWTIVRMRRKMEYTCWCIGRPFGILLTLPRHRAISGQYLMNDYFIAATNSSDHWCDCCCWCCRRNSYTQSHFAMHERVYIIHIMFDDMRHGRYVIFKPFIWWHDVIEPHKKSLCHCVDVSTVKMERQTKRKRAIVTTTTQANKDEAHNYENTQGEKKKCMTYNSQRERLASSAPKRWTSGSQRRKQPPCIRIRFV